jgi:Na+-driven multidrug efflux pump
MSGFISVNTNSAMTAVVSFMMTIYTIPFGMGVAASIVVGT